MHSDSPPPTPDLEDEPAPDDSVQEDLSCEGGFLCEGEDIPAGVVDKDGDESTRRNFIIQPPTADCPHFRLVPASGFFPKSDSPSLAALPAVPTVGTAEGPANCNECGATSTSVKYKESFGVNVCQECIDSNPESYGLVTKTAAIDEYCIGEGDLEGLGCIRRRNPRKQGWNEMRLLLRAQVAQRSLAKHGSAQGIEQARRKRAEDAARRKRQREGRESVLRSSEPAPTRTPEVS